MSSESEDTLVVDNDVVQDVRLRWKIVKQGLNCKRILQSKVWNYSKRCDQWIDIPEVSSD